MNPSNNLHSLSSRVGAARQAAASKSLSKKLYRFATNRKFIRYSLVTLNVLLFAGIAWFTLGPTYRGEPLGRQGVISSGSGSSAATEPLDQLSSVDIAKQAALAAGLSDTVTVAVINQADTARTELAVAPADNTVVAKPQLVATPFVNRYDIKEYVVQEGDTVASIASHFGVTSDSVMWSNGLRGNYVATGTTLLIPPRNGIVYTVAEGDNLDELARKYRADRNLLVAVNDIELTGLRVGERILIPDGIEPAPARTTTVSRLVWGGGNGYIYGYCTWHVANRRAAIGNPLPNNLGNASSWYRNAIANGMPVGSTPQAGAVLWHVNTSIAGGLGHVGYVERVNPDGSILVSDMNYPAWGRISHRTIHPGELGNYRFIY